MRKTLLMIIATLSAACTSNNPELKFSSKNLEHTSPKATLNLSYPYVECSNPRIADEMNKAITSVFLDENIRTIESYIDQVQKFEQDSIPYDNTSRWYGFMNERMVSIHIEHYLFTGGAHGGTFVSALTFDRKNGEQVNIKNHISDTSSFRHLMIEEYINQNDLDPAATAGEIGYFTELENLPIPQTMILSPEGLVVIYNQYEIACYAVGITSATIPYSRLKGLLDLETSNIQIIETDK